MPNLILLMVISIIAAVALTGMTLSLILYLRMPPSHEPRLLHVASVVSDVPDVSNTEEHVFHVQPDSGKVTIYHKGSKIPFATNSTHIIYGESVLPIQKETSTILDSSTSNRTILDELYPNKFEGYKRFYIQGKPLAGTDEALSDNNPFHLYIRYSTAKDVLWQNAYLVLDLTEPMYASPTLYNMNVLTIADNFGINSNKVHALQFYSGLYRQYKDDDNNSYYVNNQDLYASTPDLVYQTQFSDGDLTVHPTMSVITWDNKKTEGVGTPFWSYNGYPYVPYLPNICNYHDSGQDPLVGSLWTAMIIPIDSHKPGRLNLKPA